MMKLSLRLLLIGVLCGVARSAFVELGTFSKDGVTKKYYYESNAGTRVPLNNCPSPKTQLSIDSVEEQTYIFSRVASENSITQNNNILTSGFKVQEKFVWQKSGDAVNNVGTTTTSPFNYGIKWCAGEPNNSGGSENCVTISKRSTNAADICFNDYSCNAATTGFICQEVVVAQDLTYIGGYNFRDGLGNNVGMTYYLNTKDPKTPDQAAEYCDRLGDGWTLAMIPGGGEQDYIIQQIHNSALVGTNWRVSIGLKLRGGVWQDRYYGPTKPITYGIKWLPTEPNNMGGIENCVSLYKTPDRTGMMDVACGTDGAGLFGFLCSRIQYR